MRGYRSSVIREGGSAIDAFECVRSHLFIRVYNNEHNYYDDYDDYVDDGDDGDDDDDDGGDDDSL